MKRSALLIIAVTALWSNASSASIEACSRILDEGIRDTYRLQSASSFDSIIKKFLSMSNEQLSSGQRSNDFGVGIPVPIGKSFAKLAFSNDSRSARLRSIKDSYTSGGLDSVSSSDYTWLAQNVVNQGVPNAWLKCIELTLRDAPEGITVEVEGDVSASFALRVKWAKSVAGQNAPRVREISGAGITFPSGSVLAKGESLLNLKQYVIPVRRTEAGEGSVLIAFDNANDLFVSFPSTRKRSSVDRLQGTWSLAGLPMNMRIAACLECPQAHFLIQDALDARSIAPFPPSHYPLENVILTLIGSGEGVISLLGNSDQAGAFSGASSCEPGSFCGGNNPFLGAPASGPKNETLFFSYSTEGGSLSIAFKDVDLPGFKGAKINGVPFQLVDEDMLVLRDPGEGTPIVFVRKDSTWADQ